MKTYWERALSVMVQIEKIKPVFRKGHRERFLTQSQLYHAAYMGVWGYSMSMISTKCGVPSNIALAAIKSAKEENETALR